MKDKKHSNGFNTPKDYFEDFENRLFSKISEDIIPKESGFKTPEGYFKQLDSVILESLEASRKQVKVVPLFTIKTIAYAAAIAACAILVFSLTNTTNTIDSINTLEISNIESYIEEGNLNVDLYDIASLLKDVDLNNISLENEFISEDILEEYLLENIDDSSILIEVFSNSA